MKKFKTLVLVACVMGVTHLKNVIPFPEGFPQVTAGIFLGEKRIIVTGHENGSVYRWDIDSKTPTEMYSCGSPVRAISCSANLEIAVGSESGLLILLGISNEIKPKIIQEAEYSKRSRVWRAVWLGKDTLVTTSTYGVIKCFTRSSSGQWNTRFLQGHSNSIFGAGSSDGRFLATADFSGNIILWEHDSGDFSEIQRLDVVGNIQDLDWYKDEVFAAVTRAGRILLFEKEGRDSKQWQLMYEIEIATGRGNSVDITDDGKTVFVGTDSEFIQFDLDSQQTEQHPISSVKKIFSLGNEIYVLTNKGLFGFCRKEIEVKTDLISYRFAKISLLGHTGTGKTTLANYIISGNVAKVQSTFGKRVWNWILPKDNGAEKRVILSDYGGQEVVLETFLPFLKDSDMFLIFYKQTEKTSFDNALRILNLLSKKVKSDANVVFVQTFIDHEMNVISETEIQRLLREGKIKRVIKVSPTENMGLDEFMSFLRNAVPWDNARIMIRSPLIEGITKALVYVQEKGYPAVAYSRFKAICQEILNQKIFDRHLRFLLRNYSNQGIIDYYPEITDLIIFNDERYNKLMTNIPIYAEHHRGIVEIDELKKEFKNSPYVEIIDEVYSKTKISIRNGKLRIFPEELTTKSITTPPQIREQLKGVKQNDLKLPVQHMEIGRLIEALSEIGLQCNDVTQKEGIFSWEDKAFVYYSFTESGDEISGRYINCRFYVGGKDEKRKDRLTSEFTATVGNLYGILSLHDESESEIKKKESKHVVFDVALSFAGEQRDYVRQVAERLEGQGIKVFYDEFFESQLWGRNLPNYLKDVYYSKSNYCIIFISDDYTSKMWPVYEGKCANARDLEEFGDYILPVVFEGAKMPGLDPGKKYLSASKHTPQQIADIFVKRFEEDQRGTCFAARVPKSEP